MRAEGTLLWIGVAFVVGALLLPGCPRGGTTTSGSGSPCARSIDGDLATARSRLDKGRVDDAVLYVDALVGCPGVLESPRFLQVALDVYEEVGRLNEAWSVGSVALVEIPDGEPARDRIIERLAAFESRYALLVSPRDGRGGLTIEHTGPVTDAATEHQLKAVRMGRGVLLDAGQRGFWLFPGGYRIEGEEMTLKAGERTMDPRP